jgi:hypothetical protein
MPIFARRRLQAMLNDLAPHLTDAKASDFLARLEHKRTQDALAAEVELGLLWGIGQVADIVIDPELPNSTSRPDASSTNLFARAPVVVEITAISDDSFSGQSDMDRAANIMVQFANTVRKGAGEHLYFEYMEKSYYADGRYHRVRCIDGSFKLTPELQETLRFWLKAPDWPNPEFIRLADTQIDVVIRWKRRCYRFFAPSPPCPQ